MTLPDLPLYCRDRLPQRAVSESSRGTVIYGCAGNLRLGDRQSSGKYLRHLQRLIQ